MRKLQLPWWWYIAPAYLTLWTVGFSLWNFMDGEGMMQTFGVDTGNASEFIMLNSAARYIAIAVGMLIGIWIFRTYTSIMTALVIRLTMDILDLAVGLNAGMIVDFTGIFQSMLMFLIPNFFAIFTLFTLTNKSA